MEEDRTVEVIKRLLPIGIKMVFPAAGPILDFADLIFALW
jgi:hypothetical protein